MPKNSTVKRMYKWKPFTGRPKYRWKDDVRRRRRRRRKRKKKNRKKSKRKRMKIKKMKKRKKGKKVENE
jgi:hypothetical protein